MNRLSRDAKLNERDFNALWLIPAALRRTARDAVEKFIFLDADENKAALEALQQGSTCAPRVVFRATRKT